ncbi:oligosaccharide flippase family protein [Flavicella sp.]|uniref:oligosaccharide flippase family protein n=1 Tax=Flavicella sp. TaxID=2957742 RepID=UPI0030191F71
MVSSNTSKYIKNSFIWGFLSKILDSIVKFISVPLLLTYFGKEHFGLIALAFSINAYLQILDMGVNIGSVKYFSEWILLKKHIILSSVARTSISFYFVVGLVNFLLLVGLSFFTSELFSLNQESAEVFKELLFVLATIAIINWSTTVFMQLLIANENMVYIQQWNVIKSLLNLVVLVVTLFFNLSLLSYFILYVSINTLIFIPYYIKVKNEKLIDSVFPGFDWLNFRPILKYSLALILMAVFQATATKMRPIVLGVFSDKGVELIADYRIMETISIFIISIGGMFITIFLPKTSKLILVNNQIEIQKFAYSTTKYTSFICCLLCFPLLLNSENLILLYVGVEYVNLSFWLNIWIITILFFLHNTPIASLVLSTGKTKMLVYSSGVACVVSLVVNSMFVEEFGAGSAVFGYSIYILIQMSFYYLYFNSKVLGLNSLLVFKSFVIPSFIGFCSLFLLIFLDFEFENTYVTIFIKSLVWYFVFFILILLFRVFTFSELKRSLLTK